jgi:hypothetical protein
MKRCALATPLEAPLSEPPLAIRHVWRQKVLDLPTAGHGAIMELFHWFGRADVYPVAGGQSSTDRTWYVQSWRRPRYLLSPRVTSLDIRAGYASGAVLRVRLLPLSTARPLERAARGRTAEVLAYHGPAVTATVSFRTASVYASHADGVHARLLVAKGGLQRMPVQIPAGPVLLSMETDNPWTIELT